MPDPDEYALTAAVWQLADALERLPAAEAARIVAGMADDDCEAATAALFRRLSRCISREAAP